MGRITGEIVESYIAKQEKKIVRLQKARQMPESKEQRQHLTHAHLYWIREFTVPIFDQIFDQISAVWTKKTETHDKNLILVENVIAYIKELQGQGANGGADGDWNSNRRHEQDAIECFMEGMGIADKDVKSFKRSLERFFSLAIGLYTHKLFDVPLYKGLVDSEHPLSATQTAETHEIVIGLFAEFVKHLEETFDLSKKIDAIVPTQLDAKADTIVAGTLPADKVENKVQQERKKENKGEEKIPEKRDAVCKGQPAKGVSIKPASIQIPVALLVGKKPVKRFYFGQGAHMHKYRFFPLPKSQTNRNQKVPSKTAAKIRCSAPTMDVRPPEVVTHTIHR
jgi:hypothetical protein